MNFPRVLIVALGRINAADTANNGLLLRNLFGVWPKENLAQIFSSGGNGNEGFFGHYYQLGPMDRRFGSLFYRIKAEAQKETASKENPGIAHGTTRRGKIAFIKSQIKHLLVDTGLYELIFRPCLSREMLEWVKAFQPDIIFAQGYNLAFTWLPIMLANHCGLPIAYYPTDDWPSNRFRRDSSRFPCISTLARRAVEDSSRQLVALSSLRLTFNPYMQKEYLQRYGYEFKVLMHGDEACRFVNSQLKRLANPDEYWIVSTGDFDRHRWPLLTDLDEACDLLNSKGIRVRATIFPVNKPANMTSQQEAFRHVYFEPCPSHSDMVGVLRGADILFLPERFDETSNLIRLSVSSKAHLFMFSGRPIVVYSDPVAGVSRYAREEGWAAVVERRDPSLLAEAFERLICDNNERQNLIDKARNIAIKTHHLPNIQSIFHDLLCTALSQQYGRASASEHR